MNTLVGQSLGRYHLLEQLGEGGMATVYKAFDTRLERTVAVKVIRTDFDNDPQFLLRFEREAKALARLSHPHIVHVLDAGEHQGIPYVVMDFFAGGTLRQRLGRPLPNVEAARLLAPIARALEYAHGQGIIHRDVKPANVLLSPDGQPMLSDFGIAKLLDPQAALTGLTMTGVGIGTPDYMAPEQGLGQATPQTDVYALGVMLYELVTGRRPYEADTPIAVLLKHAADPLPRPRDVVPDLPAGVEQVVLRALAKKPEDRYANMGEFAAVLESLAQATLPSSPASRPLAGIRPRAWVWAAGFALVGLFGCAVLLAGAWLLRPTPTAPSQTALSETAPSTTPAEVVAAVSAGGATDLPTATAAVGPISTAQPPTATATPAVNRLPASDKDGMPQVFIPAGKFVIGAHNEVVELDAFWIDQTEVTNAMYARCVAAGICPAPAGASSQTRKFYFQNPEYDDYPVVFVSWDDAQTYCNWVGRRLPTGSEWEKAARGTDGRLYPWGDRAPDGTRANYDKQVGDTTAVGSYPDGASPYGVLDLAGNVAEWTDEWMDGTYRVSRGGSWTTDGKGLGSVLRYGVTPTRKFGDYGFRCATRAAPEPDAETGPTVTLDASLEGPVFTNFRACDKPCTETGANVVAIYPEFTSEVYVSWDYSGMVKDMPYTRTWSHHGVEWVRYHCLWRGPETGTFSIRLWDNEGLRSGTWTLSIRVDNEHDFTFNVPIEGVFDLFTPAGQPACPDFR